MKFSHQQHMKINKKGSWRQKIKRLWNESKCHFDVYPWLMEWQWYIQVPIMMIITYQNYYYIKQRISWMMSLHATHNPWNKCPSTSSWLCLAHLQNGPNMKKIKFAWDAMDNYFTTICSRQNQIKNESQSQSMDKFNKYPMMIVR